VVLVDAHDRERPRVRVSPHLGDPRWPVTVVCVSGEHDFSVRKDLERALEPLHGHVLVDLSSCTFIDSSIVAMILTKHAALERDGERLELFVPNGREQVVRKLDRLGARRLLRVVDTLPILPDAQLTARR
jgi:anti-anti-sigma regulatory factor